MSIIDWRPQSNPGDFLSYTTDNSNTFGAINWTTMTYETPCARKCKNCACADCTSCPCKTCKIERLEARVAELEKENTNG